MPGGGDARGDRGVARFRFHGILEDLLPLSRRGATIEQAFTGERCVKDAIEALGVPHPEIDAILIDGLAVDFDRPLHAGDLVDVFPPAYAPAHGSLTPPIPSPPRFVLDGHLGRLARYLRMLGFDAAYRSDADDEWLAQVSAREARILLTRDRGLLRRAIVRNGYLPRSDDPRTQLDEVIRRYGLATEARPFTRCIRCNGRIEPVSMASVAARLEPKTKRYYDTFGRCDTCGAVYWPGSHFERMRRFVDDVTNGTRPQWRPPER